MVKVFYDSQIETVHNSMKLMTVKLKSSQPNGSNKINM